MCLPLITEQFCNVYCWSVGFLGMGVKDIMCSWQIWPKWRSLGLEVSHSCLQCDLCNTFSSWLNACALLWNSVLMWKRRVTEWWLIIFNKLTPIVFFFSCGVLFYCLDSISIKITSFPVAFPTRSQKLDIFIAYENVLKESARCS